ncbi:homocysteine-responsive endoplasmic reticulum-resident ubiquitin-like domain member 1 protein [Denticeps clupeoides]|uniref:Ubiquitin-like domain-containing protein n=1 Tax=Denticeps clupeoides TaxID=299321 RepID=A0AAY4DR43_9TELE|nr:homocysteine-responsive endoplasmic reticulum-resident ubiquitin-like domain member 1 protein [Denticeps clupeoides]
MDGGEASAGKPAMTLVVKTPNGLQEDQIVVGVDLSWTVADLKAHLSRVYPTHPAAKDQRLIYCGKLLPDHLPVRDAFRKEDSMPTLHLVYAVRAHPEAQQGVRSKVKVTEQKPSSASLQNTERPVQPSPVATAPSGLSEDGLRDRGHPVASWMAAAMPGTAGVTHPSFPSYSLYSPQQLLWLQHMYARQCYMHYHASLAAASSASVAPVPGTSLPVSPHQAAVPPALPNQAVVDNPAPNQNAPEPAFINPEEANQNLRMNAQGGPVMEDEEGLERDWLDWVYTIARFGVFLSIVYFYSNLSRFILVMSSLLLMYLHTAGWFPFRQRPVGRGPNVPAAVVNQDALANPQPVAPHGGGDGAEPAAGHDEQPPLAAVLVPPHRVSVVWTAWVFFKAFFASLIPELPQGVAD